MSTLTPTATVRRSPPDVAAAKGESNRLIAFGARTVELAAASSGSTIDFGNIPANMRIAACSRIYWDDLATSGSPTLDLGLFAVNGNVTSLSTALGTGLAISAPSTANVGNIIPADYANAGKHAYELLTAQATDPGGFLKIKGTVKAAATTQTGTITLDLYGYLD